MAQEINLQKDFGSMCQTTAYFAVTLHIRSRLTKSRPIDIFFFDDRVFAILCRFTEAYKPVNEAVDKTKNQKSKGNTMPAIRSPRSSREKDISPPPTSSNTSSNRLQASSPVASAPPPPPTPAAPPPNVHARYMSAIADVFIGAVTPPNDLFCPLDPYNMMSERMLGTANPRARELFSLANRLVQEARQVPMPKNRGQKEDYDCAVKVLRDQARQAADLFWHEIRGSIPDSTTYGTIEVRDGWRIVTCVGKHESEMSDVLAQIAAQLDLPPDLVAAMAKGDRGLDLGR